MPIAYILLKFISFMIPRFLHTWIAVEIPEISLHAQILLSCGNIIHVGGKKK
jgi:hypothetical protein